VSDSEGDPRASVRVRLLGRPEERAAIRRALAGTKVEVVGDDSPDPVATILPDARQASSTQTITSGVEQLTAREQQVLELLAEGLPNKAIATRLTISDQTVKFHVAAISSKLGARNRTDAVRLAIRRGLITL
jgi:DNA-binding NarL/FixJ family response regulator